MSTDDLTTASAPEEGPWKFDHRVAERFDDMIERSIPGHEDMREIVADLGARVLECRTSSKMLDVGCSTGQTILDIARLLHQRGYEPPVFFEGFDSSAPMVAKAVERLHGISRSAVYEYDLEFSGPGSFLGTFDLVTCVLALQFTRPEIRPAIMERLWRMVRPGGALILVEKTQPEELGIVDMLRASYHDAKRANGYTDAAIVAKEKALNDVLYPLSAKENKSLLWDVGALAVQEVWRNRQFAGWIATRSHDGS